MHDTRPRLSASWSTAAAILLAASCGLLAWHAARAAQGKGATAVTFKLTSPAFEPGGAIPSTYTCQGRDVSPPLEWEGVPRQAKSLALTLSDPDAPDPAAPRTTWVHWVLYDIPPDRHALREAMRSPPAGAKEGRNDWKRTGYGGPCPPIGRHRYFFELYALDVVLGDLGEPTKAQLEKAMKGHIIARAELLGMYEKQAQ